MAKSGRYSADRKKVEALTTSKTIEIHDCGTIFFCDVGDATMTLPTAASAGNGWWVKFVLSDEPGTKLRVSSGDGAGTMPVSAIAADGVTQSDGCQHLDLGTSGDIGDVVEVICDGSKMYAFALIKANAASSVS